MFHFPTFPPLALCVQARVTGHDSSWVSPFGHPRITARLPTPQGLSQATTSFIGSRCQGIHHVPFIACHLQKLNTTFSISAIATKMLASTIQISNNTPTPATPTPHGRTRSGQAPNNQPPHTPAGRRPKPPPHPGTHGSDPSEPQQCAKPPTHEPTTTQARDPHARSSRSFH